MKANRDNRVVSGEPARAQVLRLSETSRSVPAVAPVIAGLAAGQVVAIEGEGGAVTLRFGTVEVSAKLHASVEPVVLRRALERGELVIAQQQSDGWLVIGVLRTSATPGLDVGDDYVIAARRVTVQAEHEVLLTSGAARVALAALGRIESVAKQITSRASLIHKIIGRTIQLN